MFSFNYIIQKISQINLNMFKLKVYDQSRSTYPDQP